MRRGFPFSSLAVQHLTSPVSTASPPIATLLKSCKTLRSLEQVHVLIIRKGLEHDNYLTSRFVSLCNSPSILPYVTSVFNRVSYPSACLWNSLLKAYCEHSTLLDSLSVLSAMRVYGAAADEYTFPPLIKCCSDELAIRTGVGIHGLSIKFGVESNVFVGSSLIDFYGKCKLPEHAQTVFDEMSVRNVVSWTALAMAFVNSGDLGNARRVFDTMPKRNRVSWNAMISGYAGLGDLSCARKLFDEMPFKDVISYTLMIDGYAKSGDMVSARYLFEQCPDKDTVTWSALICGYVQNGLPEEAIKFFLEMERCSAKADEFVMVSIMSACAELGCWDLAKWIDSYMSRSSFELCRSHIAAALVHMNVKCGNMARASYVFNNMTKRDLISYCSMIQGLTIHGQGVGAVKLFYNMISEGITPDNVAFTVILTACSRSALVEEGCLLFDMMRNQYSITPSPDHYACIVDLLGRFGHLEAAYDLLKSMPVEPHAGAWGALLGACWLHCHTEVAEVVANRLFELEPLNAGNFVLLSNIYAGANRWVDVAILRNQMVDRGLRKIPGRSWIC